MVVIILFYKVYSRYEKCILMFHSNNVGNFPIDMIFSVSRWYAYMQMSTNTNKIFFSENVILL